ncbi:MAG TPA: NifU N-terminal domain-containing protein [Rhodothermales bacterium]
MPRFNTDPTPNPNSLKFTTDAGLFIPSGMESFSSAAEAEAHPLGSRLFAIPGVANVFILPQFLTITKTPAANWNVLLPKVRAALEAHFAGN